MTNQSIDPRIVSLRLAVQETFGRQPIVHNDFVALVDEIERKTRQHISESTLERLWNYSTRKHSGVSLHTLNLLALYAGKNDWKIFCQSLRESDGQESELFDADVIDSAELLPDDRLQIGWLPDRICTVRYLGDNRFIAEECINSTMQPGDTFSCLQFQLHRPLTMDAFRQKDADDDTNRRYTVGSRNGLTTLKKL